MKTKTYLFVCQNEPVCIGMSWLYKFILPICTYDLCRYISECTGLDPAWDKLKTEAKFPIVFGTLVQVICDPGYELEGSNTIACDRDTTFNFVEQPACKELGKLYRHCLSIN